MGVSSLDAELRKREDAARRKAARLDFRIAKHRNGQDAGRYAIINKQNGVVSSHDRTWTYSFNIDELEAFLERK